MKCEKCSVELEEYECSRTDERITVPHRPSQCLANLTAQCDHLAARLATAVEALTEIAGLDAVEILHRPSVPIARASEALAAISATGGKETR